MQPPNRWALIGSASPQRSSCFEAFRQGLRDLGYVEGQNLVIERRYAEGSRERFRDLVAELVRLQVEVIVTSGLAATQAAQHRLPAMYGWKMYVEAGGRMTYVQSLPDMWRRAAVYVDKILKGANPADLPKAACRSTPPLSGLWHYQ